MTDKLTDAEIVALYVSREQEATACTAQRFGSYCFAVAHRILGNEQDAEECVNDTYLRAWESIPPHHPENLAGFLGKLTRSIAINRLRERQRLKRGGGEIAAALDELCDCTPDPHEDPARWTDSVALRETIETFLAAESESSRRVFLLRYFYLCPVAEIAREMGMGESRVKMLLLRARERLHKALVAQGLA